MAATTAPPPKVAPKMALSNLIRGKQTKPQRIVLFGVEGVGKSTFAASAPKPIFLGAEDGTWHLDATRFPTPETWDDANAAVRTLTTEQHDFKTFVLDTANWLEALLWSWMCKKDGQDTIESYGYGKGYEMALPHWRAFLQSLDRLRDAKGMHIIVLAHALVKNFKNPEGFDFDRYELATHAKSSGVIKQWADIVLFSNFETFATKDDPKNKMSRAKGIGSNARLIYTARTPAYDAKNRSNLPTHLPLDWNEFWKAFEGSDSHVEALRSEILRKAAELGGDVETKAKEMLADPTKRDSISALNLINNRLNALIAQKSE